MNRKNTLLLSLLFLGSVFTANAQVVTLPCPPNSDFELGDYSVWHYYIGSCCPGGVISTPYLLTTPPPTTGPGAYGNILPSSFDLMSTTAAPLTDPWGCFPTVGAGGYSLRIGSCRTLYYAERARYYVHVPAGLTNYSLIYKYAVVLENPNHSTATQPRFTVVATDSNSNTVLPCANFNYVSGALPGFDTANKINAVDPPPPCGACGETDAAVEWKPWATTSINLSGYSGHTVIMDFAAGDCGQGGHWGYGYVDMTCGTFAINTLGCGDTIATVSAPSGFANYAWYDSSTFTTLYGTTQTVTFPMPDTPTTYAVIMSPFAGFGCPDTLYTRIEPTNLQLHPGADTLICSGQSATLTSGATDVAPPLTYAWAPASSLNCVTCANPVATPFAGTTVYTFTVTDKVGCNKTDSLKVTVDSVAGTALASPTSCFGYSDGSVTATPTSGYVPYTYSWSTVPSQTTSIATGLPIGLYTDTIKDVNGCKNTVQGTVTQPPPLTMSIAGYTNPTTCGGSDGTITLTGFSPSTGIGTTNYTIRYLFNGIPSVIAYASSTTGTIVLTGLAKGAYDSISVVITAPACPYNVVGPIVLTDPPPPALPFVSSNSPICLNSTLNLTTSDVTLGVTYTWSGPAGYTSTTQNPTISPAAFVDSGYYVVTVMVNNCTSKDSSKVIINNIPDPTALNNGPKCSADTLRLTGGYVAPGGADAYFWNGPNGFVSNLQNPSISNVTTAATGTYTIAVTYLGCTGYDSTEVVINQIPDAPIVLDTNYCQGTVAPPISASGIAGDTLKWYIGPTGGVGDTIAPTPSTTDTGTTVWYVTQTSPTDPPCTSVRAPLTVGVFTLPHPTFTVTDSVYCRGTYFTFGVNGSNTGSDYSGITWDFGFGDSIQNVNPVVHAFDGTGADVVTATVHYKVCPDVSISHNIMVYPYPVLTLGADTSICPGGEAIVIGDQINPPGPNTSWLWSTGETTPGITIVAPGTYYAKVTINGCPTSDTVIVLNDCYMNIPNVFTPNGDGVNDYFYPRQFLTKGLTTFSMNIYNRWGQLVFTSTSIDGRGWDGQFNGVPQPEGVFIYIIDATFKDGQKEHHQGNITLLR